MQTNSQGSFLHVLFTEIERDVRSLPGQMRKSPKRKEQGCSYLILISRDSMNEKEIYVSLCLLTNSDGELHLWKSSLP